MGDSLCEFYIVINKFFYFNNKPALNSHYYMVYFKNIPLKFIKTVKTGEPL